MVIRAVHDQDWIAAIVFLFKHWYFHWDAAMLTLKGKPQQYLPRSSFDTWLVLQVGVFFSSKVFRVLVFSSWKLFSAFFIENFWTLQKRPKSLILTLALCQWRYFLATRSVTFSRYFLQHKRGSPLSVAGNLVQIIPQFSQNFAAFYYVRSLHFLERKKDCTKPPKQQQCIFDTQHWIGDRWYYGVLIVIVRTNMLVRSPLIFNDNYQLSITGCLPFWSWMMAKMLKMLVEDEDNNSCHSDDGRFEKYVGDGQ